MSDWLRERARCSDWLPERARWACLARFVPAILVQSFGHVINPLLIKLVRWRLLYIGLVLDRTSLVNKGFIIWPKDYTTKIAGTKRAIPSGQDRPILPARVANQNTGFASSCPLAEPAKIEPRIKSNYNIYATAAFFLIAKKFSSVEECVDQYLQYQIMLTEARGSKENFSETLRSVIQSDFFERDSVPNETWCFHDYGQQRS